MSVCRKCLNFGLFEPERRVCRSCRNLARKKRKRKPTYSPEDKREMTTLAFDQLLSNQMDRFLHYVCDVTFQVTKKRQFLFLGNVRQSKLIRGIVRNYAPTPPKLCKAFTFYSKESTFKEVEQKFHGNPFEVLSSVRRFINGCNIRFTKDSFLSTF